MAVGTDGNFAIVTDADGRSLAPDKRPPWTGRSRAEDGAFFGQGLQACGVRSGAQFTVDFVLIDVGQKLIKQAIGPLQFQDVVGSQQGRQTLLPEVVTAFDLAFGLGEWERSGGPRRRNGALGPVE